MALMPALFKTLLEHNYVQLHIGKAVHNAVQSREEPRPQQVAVSLMQFDNLFEFAINAHVILSSDVTSHGVM